jgi:hypothetical protein
MRTEGILSIGIIFIKYRKLYEISYISKYIFFFIILIVILTVIHYMKIKEIPLCKNLTPWISKVSQQWSFITFVRRFYDN